jgi:hypothetical protein
MKKTKQALAWRDNHRAPEKKPKQARTKQQSARK